MPKRGNSEGRIYGRADGRYEARIVVGHTPAASARSSTPAARSPGGSRPSRASGCGVALMCPPPSPSASGWGPGRRPSRPRSARTPWTTTRRLWSPPSTSSAGRGCATHTRPALGSPGWLDGYAQRLPEPQDDAGAPGLPLQTYVHARDSQRRAAALPAADLFGVLPVPSVTGLPHSARNKQDAV